MKFPRLSTTIKPDKLAHFVYGTLFYLILAQFIDAPVYTFLAVVILASLKELADAFRQDHTPDFFDLLATAAGGAVCLAVKVF